MWQPYIESAHPDTYEHQHHLLSPCCGCMYTLKCYYYKVILCNFMHNCLPEM